MNQEWLRRDLAAIIFTTVVKVMINIEFIGVNVLTDFAWEKTGKLNLIWYILNIVFVFF